MPWHMADLTAEDVTAITTDLRQMRETNKKAAKASSKTSRGTHS